MRETFALLGFAAFCTISVVVGSRLLLLWRRTRRLPELLIGISFFATAAQLVFMVYGGIAGWNPIQATFFRFLYSLACATILLVAWRVFRPEERWASLLAWTVLAQLTTYALRNYLPIPTEYSDLVRHPAYWWDTFGQIAPFVWITLESLYCQAMLRRRWQLGIEPSPALADRMLLWGIGLGAMAGVPIVPELYLLFNLLMGRAVEWQLFPFLIFGLGMICSASLWCAFFPPAPYRRWVERRRPPEAR